MMNVMVSESIPMSDDSQRHLRPNAVNRSNGGRRGVASVLAMMFLMLFSSLAAVMAILAQGNVQTAYSSLRISRALSAAESGLAFAARRLRLESRRFIVDQGVIDSGFGERLWLGTWVGGDGSIEVNDPDGYVVSNPSGPGLVHAIHDAHRYLDDYEPIDDEGVVHSLMLDSENGIITTPPIRLGTGEADPWFRLRYELLADGSQVRVTSQGHDQGIRRNLQLDFLIDKKIEFAVLAPNRIMIGKNVLVDGPIGSLYGTVQGELEPGNGDPLVLRSDYYDLDAVLDEQLDAFYSAVALHDVDGDNRLRPAHPTESDGVALQGYFQDRDGDEYVDDFDLFLGIFDSNGDGLVIYDETLAASTGHPGSLEFEIDPQLGPLVDGALPDRNSDGQVDGVDTALGWKDGVLDKRDRYAKARGGLNFAVARDDWDTANGEGYQNLVQGPVSTGPDVAPAAFEVGEPEMIELNTDMFSTSQTWFSDRADSGRPFGNESSGQVATGISSGGVYSPAGSEPAESVPYGSLGAYDYYQRPVYEDMTFTDVKIPKGTNALFRDCTFIGVTWIETESDCTDPNWNYSGSVEPDGFGGFTERFPDLVSTLGNETVTDTRSYSNNLRFEGCTFLGSLAGDRPGEYTHWRNKIQMTGNTRCFIDPYDPDLLQEGDAATLQSALLSISKEDRAELARSSILMPGWSVDVGNFENDSATKIKLSGTIVAGLIDIRGTADVHGTVLMTYRPEAGQGPLFYGGTPDAFNTTLGYFGNEEGDGEGVDPDSPGFAGFGEITLRYDPDGRLPDGIPWPIRMSPLSGTYVEGGSL
ncbi:MAG: hypothetical protein CMJ40_04820 [Phycisphaerae bacterium]|nr:hypothetical protein [Phycisphaerae bacterium]